MVSRVLVIDDDVDVLDVLGDFLRGVGHLVRAVSSGTEAVQALDDPFDVAVLDVALPDHSFRELLRIILDRQPSCRVIVATGFPPKDGDAPLPASVVAMLHKPFAMRALAAEIDRALAAAASPAGGSPGSR